MDLVRLNNHINQLEILAVPPDLNEAAWEHVVPVHVRQQDYSFCLQPLRFEESRDSVRSGSPLPPRLGSESTGLGPIHPRLRERGRGLTVKGQAGRRRVGTLPGELHSLRRSSRILRRGPVRVPVEPQSGEVRCHIFSSQSLCNQRVLSELDPIQVDISVSPSERAPQSNLEAQGVQGSRSVNNAQETRSTLVSPIDEEVHSSLSTPSSDPARARRDPRALTDALRSLDCLYFLRLAYGYIYPPPVVDSLISAYRLSSNRQLRQDGRPSRGGSPRTQLRLLSRFSCPSWSRLRILASRTTRHCPIETLLRFLWT